MTNTCNCSAFIKDIKDMCNFCKIDYIRWSTGLTREDIKCLAKTVTVADKVKSLRMEIYSKRQEKQRKSGLHLVSER
jgi:hypothetical protein